MNLSCLLSLGDGITFHRFRKNPFRPIKAGQTRFLVPVKPPDTRSIRPALDSRQTGPALQRIATLRAPPDALAPPASAACQRGQLSRAERVEVVVLKLLALILALACIGCGFGVQHIAYVRQKAALGRQLRQKEIELSAVKQAYRSLESCVVAKAAEDFRRTEACLLVAKHLPQKTPVRS
jgi:hypothetical protein